MVVTVEPHATDIGVEVLKAGGNAVDAAVAVGFALAVTHPSAGNLGGGGFMLVRFADGRTNFIDFRERAPAASTRDMYLDAKGNPTQDSIVGYRAAGVPGTVRGLEFAHRKYGKKKWAELVAPAKDLAAKGFPVSFGLAGAIRAKRDLLGRFPDSKRIFLRDGRFHEPGDLLVQPDLARTLERIRLQGSKDFYEGETARLIAEDMRAHEGLITLDDLQNYKIVERQPLTGHYRGFEIITAPLPSSGGIGLLQMLGVLEGTEYEKAGAGSAATIHPMVETMRHFFADRSEFLGDSDFVSVPVTRLLDPKYIAAIRRSIDENHATPSLNIRPGKAGPEESTQTTHYTIADTDGNVVAVTYTLNGGFGSGVTASKLGFLLNNEMDDFSAKPGAANMYGVVQGEANAIQPNKHPLSAMTPTIVLRRGQFYLALGSPGGPTIINTVLQTIVNVLDFKMNIQQAVDWPRFHHQWLPDELRMEPGFSPDTMAILEARGHKIKLVNAQGLAISQGEVAAILSDGGWLQGAADGRTEGTAKGF
jgi:gamma-glutamyltranspeptidase/glutathione hydrolase